MPPRFPLLTLLAVLLVAASAVGHAEDAVAPAQPKAPSVTPVEPKGSGITEDQIRSQLEGKLLFLRGFYLDDNLKFSEDGQLIGNSPQKGSFTLCALEIKKVKLTKHTLELEGDRYGLHFYGALPYEDDSKPFDRVRLTGKKTKSVKITIERELVVIPKVKKPKKGDKGKAPAQLQAGATSPAADVAPELVAEGTAPVVASAAAPAPPRIRTPSRRRPLPRTARNLMQSAICQHISRIASTPK